MSSSQPTQSSRRVRRWFRRQRRTFVASQPTTWRWYRAGYIAALDDIDRTGLRPTTDKAKRESADRSLKRWIDA